jgi:hypothetical protein
MKFDVERHATSAWLFLTQVAGGIMFPAWIGRASLAIWHTADAGGNPTWEYVLILVYASFPLLLILFAAVSWVLHARRKFISSGLISAFPAGLAFVLGIWIDTF